MPLPVGTAADEIAAVLHPARVGTRRLTGPAGVVVVHEGDRALGPPADQPRRLAVRVPQAPELVFGNRLLQHRLGGKIKRRRGRFRAVQPVAHALPHRVLIQREPSVGLPARLGPKLGDVHRPRPHGVVHVLLHKSRAVSFGVIEPPPDEPDGVFEPVEPRGEFAPHVLVGVVQVRRGRERLARVAVTLAVKHGIVLDDGPRSPRPVEALPGLHVVGWRERHVAEDPPGAVLVLSVRAPVVDDDIRHRLDPRGFELATQRLEFLFCAVPAVEVVEPLGQVSLRRDGVRRRREPDGVDAGLHQRGNVREDLPVPAAVRGQAQFPGVAAAPVEALQHHRRVVLAERIGGRGGGLVGGERGGVVGGHAGGDIVPKARGRARPRTREGRRSGTGRRVAHGGGGGRGLSGAFRGAGRANAPGVSSGRTEVGSVLDAPGVQARDAAGHVRDAKPSTCAAPREVRSTCRNRSGPGLLTTGKISREGESARSRLLARARVGKTAARKRIINRTAGEKGDLGTLGWRLRPRGRGRASDPTQAVRIRARSP